MTKTIKSMAMIALAVSSAGAQDSTARKEAPPKPGVAKNFRVPPRRNFTLPNGLQVTLVPFGRVAFKGGSTDTLPLLLPAKAVADIQRISFRLNEHGVSISDEADSIRGVNDSIQEYRDSVREAIHDSLSAAMERRSDSLESATDRLADSLTEAALRKAQPKAAPAPTRSHVTPKPAAKPAAPPGTSVTPR